MQHIIKRQRKKLQDAASTIINPIWNYIPAKLNNKKLTECFNNS
nr:MAG TPA: hypothetical protein [Caudoviricetes sp.]